MAQTVKGPTRWVVWGQGSPVPEDMFHVEIADPVAEEIARQADPRWDADDEAWLVVVSATEQEIATWAAQHGTVGGFVPHRDGSPGPKVEQPRPY